MKKPLKVIQVIPSLRRGGAERFAVDLSNALAEHDGYEVSLISLADNDPEASFLKDLKPKVSYVSFGKKPRFSWSVFLRLQKWLKAYQPDIVHSHINAFEYLSWFRFTSKTCHFVHTLHSKARQECPHPMVKSLRSFFYKKNTLPVVISKDGQETFKEYYGLNNEVLIENGCPKVMPSPCFESISQDYTPKENSFLVVTVGRISEVKNQRLLVQAVLAFNKKQDQKIRLLIVGGVREPAVFNELKQIGDGHPEIQFTGAVTNPGDYLLLADAFCLTSTREGLPISLIEALSASCMPVCTTVGGIPELVQEGITGFLCPDFQVDSFRQALERALFSPDAKAIKRRGYELFESKYSIQTCAENYARIYQAVV